MKSVNNKYNVHHKRQSLVDFQNDRHWFHFEYNGDSYLATCCGAVFVAFENEEALPEDVKFAVQNKIYEMMDKYEKSWALPKGAMEIITAYHKEEAC